MTHRCDAADIRQDDPAFDASGVGGGDDMERTELREAFFAETRSDPYAHMVTHLAAQMWALGYEEALRDSGLTDVSKTFNDRMNDAIAFITNLNREEQARALIALAEIGKRVGGPNSWATK